MRKVLETVATKAPRLEILRFNVSSLSAVELINYCKRLKYLKFLINDGMVLNKVCTYTDGFSFSMSEFFSQISFNFFSPGLRASFVRFRTFTQTAALS
jgi:hypothetical protein